MSLLILLSLLSLNFSGITKGIYQSSIDLNAPYDVSIFDDPDSFDEYLEVIDEDYTINVSMAYDIFKEPNMQIQPFYSQFSDFDSLIKLGDYNRLRSLRGLEPVFLAEDEYIIVTAKEKSHLVQNNEAIQTITVNGSRQLSLSGIDTETFWLTLNSEERYVAVVPDDCTDGLSVSESHLNGSGFGYRRTKYNDGDAYKHLYVYRSYTDLRCRHNICNSGFIRHF